MAVDEKIPFIGRIPLDPVFTAQMDSGQSFVEKFREAKSLKALDDFVVKLKEKKWPPSVDS